MRGMFVLCLWPGLCRLGTFSATAHTLCTPPGVRTGWRRCWLLCPYTPCRFAPPAGASAAPPSGGLQWKRINAQLVCIPAGTAQLYEGLKNILPMQLRCVFVPERSWLGDAASFDWAESAKVRKLAQACLNTLLIKGTLVPFWLPTIFFSTGYLRWG